MRAYRGCSSVNPCGTASGSRCVARWRYAWGDGHVRGVDLFRMRDGKLAEKLSYVKE